MTTSGHAEERAGTSGHAEERAGVQTLAKGWSGIEKGQGGGVDSTDPHRWRKDAAWMQFKIEEDKNHRYIMRWRRQRRQQIEYRE